MRQKAYCTTGRRESSAAGNDLGQQTTSSTTSRSADVLERCQLTWIGNDEIRRDLSGAVDEDGAENQDPGWKDEDEP
jgi:hypothetical protein